MNMHEPAQMGIFNLTVEEKIADWILDHYAGTGIFADSQKSDLARQAKVLLGMYQDAVISGELPVYDSRDANKTDTVNNYLYHKSDLPYKNVVAFTQSLSANVKSGKIALKHINPLEKETAPKTTASVKNITETVSDYTPEALKSVLNTDIPAWIQKNALFFGIAGASIFGIYILLNRQERTVKNGIA